MIAQPAPALTNRFALPRPEADWLRFSQALLGINAAAIEAPTLPDLLHEVRRHLQLTLGVSHLVLAIVDDVAGQLRYLLPGEPATTDLYHDQALMAQAVRLRQPLLAEEWLPTGDIATLAPGVALPDSYAVLPLLCQGRVGAVLAVGHAKADAFDSAALGFLNLVATTLTLAVEKARLYEVMPRYTQSLEERVMAHTAALESEKTRFESIVQSLGEGLILLDLQSTIIFANLRAQSLLGLPLEMLAGLSVAELWHDPELALQTPERIVQDFAFALQEVETYPAFTVSRVLPPADAESTPRPQDLRLQLFPVRDGSGELFHYGLILQDITREREMDRMKDELVNVVSHELRTPLASVLGFAELLLSREFPEDRRRVLVETIHKEAERLTGLINDFLDLRRLENGRGEMTFSEVSLPEVVQSAVAGFALNQNAHTLDVHLPEALPTVRADANRLGAALRNLIGNALKYSPQGGAVSVRVSATEAAVQIAVSDQGLGLPADVIPQLFQRFYRVDSSDRREIGGTGLGLAIVKEIVAAHGGRVWAESDGPGCGSTFAFTLPLARRAATATEALDLPGLPDTPYVLLVEDDAGQVTLIQEHLQPTGLNVVAVSEPAAALRLLQQRLPVGVIMDVCLPEAHIGWELLDAIRQRHSPSQLPVIVTTVMEAHTRGLAAGATEVLVKPFDPRELLGHLQPRLGREVLVVEDEPIITKLVHAVLSRAGYRVRAVGDAPTALEYLATHQPDALIVDLLLPDMDGFALLERVRALPVGGRVPAVVMTARTLRPEDTERLQQLGATVLPKSEHTAIRLRTAIERAIHPPHSPQRRISETEDSGLTRLRRADHQGAGKESERCTAY